LVKRDCCAAACRIAELFVRSTLSHFGETEFQENGDDFIGLDDRNIAHDSSDSDVLNPNKLGFQRRLAIFQKHRNDIMQVAIDLIQGFPLGMRAGKTRDKTDE